MYNNLNTSLFLSPEIFQRGKLFSIFDLGTQDAFISLFCNPLGPSHHLPGAGRRGQRTRRRHPPTPLFLAQKGGTFFTRYLSARTSTGEYLDAKDGRVGPRLHASSRLILSYKL